MKRLLAIILILTLMMPTTFIGYANENMNSQEFSDIKDHWAEQTIKKHHKMGMLSGYPDGTFKPDQQMKRSELITLVNKYFGLKEEANQNFEDVLGSEWYAGETAKAEYYGYIEDLEARPEELASREDVVNMMSLILDTQEQTSKDEKKEFTDLKDTDKKTEERIEKFSENGYIGGYKDGSFKPKRIINRAEILTIIENILGYVVTSQEDVDNMPEGVTKVTIINPNIIIENKEIKGDVYIAPGVNGSITIRNSKIKGQMHVSGGTTKKPIQLENVEVEKIIITKIKNEPKVAITGKSNIGEIKTKAEAKIEISGETTVGEIKTKAKTELKLDKDVKVEKVIIEGKTKLDTQKGSQIKNLVAKEQAEITGEGTINRAEIKSENVVIEKRPDYVKVDDEVEHTNIGKDKMDAKNDDEKENSGGGSSSSKNNSSSNKDTTAPTWIAGYPYAEIKSNELKIFTNLNEKATVYYSVYEEDRNFTVDALIAIGNSYQAEANVAETVYSCGIETGKTYHISLTAVDTYNNKQSSVEKIAVSEIDTTPPMNVAGYPKVTDVTKDGFKLKTKIHEGGTGYYIVLPHGMAAPSAEQVKNGQDSNGTNAQIKGSTLLNAKEEAVSVVTGLGEGIAYDAYIVCVDHAGNIQAAPTKIEIATSISTDTTEPIVGNTGTITASNETANSVDISWTAGSDDRTAEGNLSYKVVYSTTNSINSVADIETSANGIVAKDWTANITSATVTGLNENTTYYFNVLVKDEAGNIAAYTAASKATLLSADTTEPTVGNGGTITASNETANSVDVSWTAGSDDRTAEGNLSYKVVYATTDNINSVADIETSANGTVAKDWTANINNFQVTGLTENTTYYFNVLVKDEAGNIAVYTVASKATVLSADATAPTVGNSGTITASNETVNSVDVSWTAGNDNRTAEGNLSYKVVYATTDNINSVADIETSGNGTVAKNWTANITSATVTGLNENTTYYFNVLVKDEAGNIAVYTVASKATVLSADTTEPTVGNGGTITASNETVSSVDISWTAGSDDRTAEGNLSYKVVYATTNNINSVAEIETSANGIVAKDWTANITSATVTGLTENTTYYFNVLVKDEAGNITAYTAASKATATAVPAILTINGYVDVMSYYDANGTYSLENEEYNGKKSYKMTKVEDGRTNTYYIIWEEDNYTMVQWGGPSADDATAPHSARWWLRVDDPNETGKTDIDCYIDAASSNGADSNIPPTGQNWFDALNIGWDNTLENTNATITY
ncbi:fibronectin type III domain-containing protein [Marinisporobacter balticus]|uniref:Fibronectin type III domain protein n=1 Tax=Marinisporobacter balticus TaxID=2018667 RepID=A0A4V2S9T1_9FIRM|nr:S-layer homology domain-containing protein [Marinisporobacter balticus]TCO69050.1 fibronectin type III domain protein [Marinisporobacter balticus]